MVPRNGTRLVALAAVAVLLSLVALKALDWPFAAIFLINGLAAGVAPVLTRREAVRVALLSLAATLLSLSGIELALSQRLRNAPERNVSSPYLEPDSLLGWRLVPGHTTEASLGLPARQIYRVKYSVDSLGFRRTVSPPGAMPQGCLFLFVDSFTFGEGLPDEESLSQRIANQTQGRFQVVNFSVPGYGAEHMLAEAEFDRVRRRAPCKPTHIIYQALPHHVVRAVGKTQYARWGPRYELTPDKHSVVYVGTPQRPGNKSGIRERLSSDFREQLNKCALFRLAVERMATWPTQDRRQLYYAIVGRAKELLEAEFPDARFDIVAWSTHEHFAGDFESFRAALSNVTPHLHLVDDIVTDYRNTPLKYQIDVRDAHPNAAAVELVATYISRQILQAAPPIESH